MVTNAESFFSLFSYFIFVALGYYIGDIIKNIADKDRLSNNIIIIFSPIVTIYYFLRSHYDFPYLPKYSTDEHYCLLPGPDAIITCICNILSLAIFHKFDLIFKGKTPEFVIHASKNLNQYYLLSYLFILPTETFLIATKGKEAPRKMKYPTLFSIFVLVICRTIIDINNKYIHFTITTLKNPMLNIILFAFIWIFTIISVIYIYPKVEVYSTFWNNYLRPSKIEWK